MSLFSSAISSFVADQIVSTYKGEGFLVDLTGLENGLPCGGPVTVVWFANQLSASEGGERWVCVEVA